MCIRKRTFENSIRMEQNRFAPAYGAPDYPVLRLEHSANWPLSGILSTPQLKITRLFGVSSDCPVSRRSNGRLLCSLKHYKSETVYDVRSHQTVQCATRLSGAPQGQTTSTFSSFKPQRSANVARTGHSTVECPVCTRLSGVPIDKELSQWLE